MSSTAQLGPGKDPLERKVCFLSREDWERYDQLVVDMEMITDHEYDGDDEDDEDEDVYFDSSSQPDNNDSIDSFGSVIDSRRHVALPSPFNRGVHQEDIFAVERQWTSALRYISAFPPHLTRRAQDDISLPRLARDIDSTIRIELETALKCISGIVRDVRSEEEEAFNRYTDFLGEQQINAPPPSPVSDSDVNMLDRANSLAKIQQQAEAGRLLTFHESSPASALAPTASELSLSPFDDHYLTRGKARAQTMDRQDPIAPFGRTMRDSPSSTWVTPDDFEYGRIGPSWVLIPATTGAGEALEEISAVSAAPSKATVVEDDGKISTSTATEEDLVDEEVEIGGGKAEPGCKGCWVWSKKVLKMALSRKR